MNTGSTHSRTTHMQSDDTHVRMRIQDQKLLAAQRVSCIPAPSPHEAQAIAAAIAIARKTMSEARD